MSYDIVIKKIKYVYIICFFTSHCCFVMLFVKGSWHALFLRCFCVVVCSYQIHYTIKKYNTCVLLYARFDRFKHFHHPV